MYMSGNKTDLLRSPETIVKTISLHFLTCLFLDSENGKYSTKDPNLEINCQTQGKFLLGQGVGSTTCIVVLALIFVVGLFGFVTNVLNVIVLRKTLKGTSMSMDRLLIMLALFDLFACLFSITFSTIIVLIQENLNRSSDIFWALKTFSILFGFARSGAIFITILVTIERYLVVAFPVKARAWLSYAKSNIYLGVTILLAAVVDLPYILNATVIANPYASQAPNTSLTEFPYITDTTPFGEKVYPKMRIVLLVMNYAAPFPLLFIFNLLLYSSISAWNKRRKGLLTNNHIKEISAAKMFSIVVLILLTCHTVSCVIFYSAQYFHVIHREFILLQNLSTTLSAAINFVVYFGFGEGFRKEFKLLFNSK